MSEEQLKELQEYNLEYLEALQSEEMFGGDYTSAVELKYAKKEIERLNNIIKEVREHIEQDIKANYFKRYDDEVYKLCDELLEILDKVQENK